MTCQRCRVLVPGLASKPDDKVVIIMMAIQMMMVVVLVKMAIMMLMMNLSVSKLSSALIAKFEIVLSLARRSYLYCGTVKLDKKTSSSSASAPS